MQVWVDGVADGPDVEDGEGLPDERDGRQRQELPRDRLRLVVVAVDIKLLAGPATHHTTVISYQLTGEKYTAG